MPHPRRRWRTLAPALLLLVALAGCGGSDFEQLEKDAAFAKACEDAGGKVFYFGWTNDQLDCHLGDD